MSTSALIITSDATTPARITYDGYISGVGATLVNNYRRTAPAMGLDAKSLPVDPSEEFETWDGDAPGEVALGEPGALAQAADMEDVEYIYIGTTRSNGTIEWQVASRDTDWSPKTLSAAYIAESTRWAGDTREEKLVRSCAASLATYSTKTLPVLSAIGRGAYVTPQRARQARREALSCDARKADVDYFWRALGELEGSRPALSVLASALSDHAESPEESFLMGALTGESDIPASSEMRIECVMPLVASFVARGASREAHSALRDYVCLADL